MTSQRNTIRILLGLVWLILWLPYAAGDEMASGLSLERFAVPESLGKLEGRYLGQGARRIIHIQDIHAHLPAQENIAALLTHLNASYGIQTVAVEGGWLSTQLANSREIPNSREKQMLARSLLERAYLTGPGYAALFSATPMTLVGIEDPALYEKNRQTYLEYLGKRERILAGLDVVGEELAEQKKTVFGPELQELDRALDDFREGKNTEVFLPLLMNLAAARDVDYSDLDQIMLYEKILRLGRSILKQKLQAEAGRLMNAFAGSQLLFEELLRSGQIPPEKMTFYPEASKYLKLLELQDQLDHQRFFSEIETAVWRLKQPLFLSKEAALLDARAERFRLAKKIVTLRATPLMVRLYEEQKELIRAEMDEPGLPEGLELAEAFYETAQKRDEVFFQKIENDPRLAGNIAVVTGGFHTEGLSERLRAANVSYMIITPDLGKQPPDESLYEKRLRIAPPAAQTLSYYLEYLEPLFDKELFPWGVSVLADTRDLNKALEVFENKSAETQREKAVSFSMEDFLALSEEKQRGQAAEWLNRLETDNLRIGILGLQSHLIKESPVAHTLFVRAKENRFNTFFLVIPPGESIREEAIGGKAPIYRTRAASLEAARKNPSLERKLSPFMEERLVAAIDPQYRASGLLTLPPDDLILLLVRPILEGRFQVSREAAVRARFLERLREIVMTLELFEQIRKAA